jgi:UDP-N-acetylglucosamine 2-epimerase (non-hydrolysing)
VLTLHRPSNVDDPATLKGLMTLFDELSMMLPLVFPMHPRTTAAVKAAGLSELLSRDRLKVVPPLPYIDNLSLVAGAAIVLTDSGGLQEETSVLGVPCLTLRTTTERPVTLELGTSRLVGNDLDAIRRGFEEAVRGDWPRGRTIPFWDGRAAMRIAAEIAHWLDA